MFHDYMKHTIINTLQTYNQNICLFQLFEQNNV